MTSHRYPDYKDSGTEWLGEVPADWELRPLGYFFRERKTTVSDKNFRPLSVTKEGIVPQLETAAKTDNGDNRKLVRSGDFVINSRSDRKGSAGVSKLDGSVSLISTVLEPRGISGRYTHYLLRSEAFQEEFYRFGTGIVADLWSTRYSAMRLITLPSPAPAEQDAIADFLDRETATIDGLIAKQEQLIATLREDRTTTITHAVTKGLDPNVEMVDSGVPWIGWVPATWNVSKVKHGFSVVLGKMYQGARQDPGDVELPHLKAGSITESGVNTLDPMMCWFSPAEIATLSLLKGDVLVIEGGATSGRSTVLDRDLPGWGFQKSLNRLRALHSDSTKFLAYLIEAARASGHLSVLCGNATIPHLTAEKLGALEWPHPSPSEQERIVDYLDDKCACIDGLIAKAEQIIGVSKEYRSALITDAVTGKIDVRGVA